MVEQVTISSCETQDLPILPNEEADRVAVIFKALSDPVRVKLLHHISANCCSSVCGCHMPERLGIGQSTLSYHLSKLMKAGLIRREMRHKWAHYYATPDGLDAARRYLGSLPAFDNCSPGTASSC